MITTILALLSLSSLIVFIYAISDVEHLLKETQKDFYNMMKGLTHES